jgi:hypothetical protein
MKYVLILVVVLLIARIDYFLGLFDKASDKLNSDQGGAEVSESISQRDVIPVNQDMSLKQTKKDTFLALLADFHSAPTAEIRNRAISILKDNPTMFTDKLDKDLENHIFRWRELLNNNEPEAVNMLLDLQNSLRGENLEMIKKFWALWMDINMDNFIAAYTRTKDTNCSIATVFGDPIPEEELVNEYVERQDALTVLLAKEKIDPVQKTLATNCSLQLKIIIEKLAPAPLPGTEQSQVPSTTVYPDPNAPEPPTAPVAPPEP